MNNKKILSKSIVIFILVNSFFCPVFAREREHYAMEFRIAAHPVSNTKIIKKAQSCNDSIVVSGDKTIAKWVPVLKEKASNFLQIGSLIKRTNISGRLEVLVILNTYDVTDKNIDQIYPVITPDGKHEIGLAFNNEGASRLRELTEKNQGRYLAQIIDGQISAIPKILCPLTKKAAIPIEFTKQIVEKISGNVSKENIASLYLPEKSIILEEWQWNLLVAFVIFLMILIAAYIYNPRIKIKRLSYQWVILSILVSSIVGGYFAGINKSIGTGDIGNSLPTIGIHVSLLNMLIGFGIGSIFGYMFCRVGWRVLVRAFYNLRLFLKTIYGLVT